MRRSVFVLTAVVAMLLSGCTAGAEPTSVPSGPPLSQPSPSPSTIPEIDMVAEALKVLGPVPAGVKLSAEQEEAARLAEVERSWTVVLTQSPDAQRPAAEFERYVKGAPHD